MIVKLNLMMKKLIQDCHIEDFEQVNIPLPEHLRDIIEQGLYFADEGIYLQFYAHNLKHAHKEKFFDMTAHESFINKVHYDDLDIYHLLKVTLTYINQLKKLLTNVTETVIIMTNICPNEAETKKGWLTTCIRFYKYRPNELLYDENVFAPNPKQLRAMETLNTYKDDAFMIIELNHS